MQCNGKKTDFLFTCGGMLLFFVDIGLDTWAVVNFYQDEYYVYLGLLLFFLLGSSVLAQIYSCLWYSYDNFRKTDTKVESCLSSHSIKALHVFQLGLYLRYAVIIELSACSFIASTGSLQAAEYLTHDLSMLRLFEAFSESAPQLVLMLTFSLTAGQADLITLLKALGSALAIAFTVTRYHMSLRTFLVDKHRQSIPSILVYCFWNLLLIGSRIAALALFASVLPCFIFPHFLCVWMVLFFAAWRAGTDFMDTAGGEWLYRATVGLIWYFSWFNVAKGNTMYKSLVYHLCMLFDVLLLCGLSCWQVYGDPNYGEPSLFAMFMSIAIIIAYLLGLVFKVIYYKFFHPKSCRDVVDPPQILFRDEVVFRSIDNQQEPVDYGENKRMRKLVDYFYT